MRRQIQTGIAALAFLALPGVAMAASEAKVSCGTASGKAATGKPIKVGGIHGNAAPGDFSSSTDAAAAYFACVNASGGIHGRPVQYLVENDQWSTLVQELLELHYDALYQRSQNRNFTGFQNPSDFSTEDLSPAGIKQLAAEIVQSRTAHTA